MREHTVLVYVLQNSVEKSLYILSNKLHSEPFPVNFGVPRYYLIFFRFVKVAIFVFCITEHIELVYILQNRVE